jgi:phage gpG-like protein
MKEFSSFGTFAAHLGRLALIGEEVTHHVTEEGAKIIQKGAQAKLGEYQEYTGPFNAWAELADSTKADRVAQGFPENEPLLRTGTLHDSIEISCSGNHAVVGSNDEVALYQEVGTDRGIPPRPFLGPAGFEAKQPIGVMAANTMIAWVSGRGWKRPAKEIANDTTVDL